jgi:hypothetical protein
MKESIVYLLILVFTETGAPKPTVKVTVMPDRASCERSREAIQKGAAFPVQVCECAALDVRKVNEVLQGRQD